MSSRTETLKPHVPKSSGLAVAGRLAPVVGLGLLGLFIWQAGVLAPPAPQDIVSPDVVVNPNQGVAENASISGRDKNNRPYAISAVSGTQDQAQSHIIHMQGIASQLERPSGAALNITSNAGRYDRNSQDLQLQGDVVFEEPKRFRAVMQSAAINIESQTMVSQSPVKVDMDGAFIEAGTMTVSDNGERLLFKGGVKARFTTKQDNTGDGP